MTIPLKRKEMYIIEKIFTEKLVFPIVKSIKWRFITPNKITIFNLLLASLNIIVLAMGHLEIISAILIQIYLLFDILDGNLARYTGRCTKLGAKLDNFGDRVIYNGIIVAIGLNRIPLFLLIMVLLVHNLHGALATYYIVPNIKKIKKFKRYGIKKFLMDKGIIFGMDLTLLDFIISISIITKLIYFSFTVILFLYVFDIIYRLFELMINQRNEVIS